MPYLLNSPEGWFRTKQCDIHELAYVVPDNIWELTAKENDRIKRQYRQDSEKLTKWFEENLPGVELTILGSSEYSGYILGGPTMKVANFDEAGRKAFEAHWLPKQPWQIVIHSYADWAKRIASVRLLETPANPDESCRWWDTPEGIVLMSADFAGKLLSQYDANWLLKQFRPKLAKVEEYAYPYGEYYVQTKELLLIIGYGSYKVPEWSGDQYRKNRQRISAMRVALGLTRRHKARVIIDDF